MSKFRLNTITSLILQIVTIISGLILPRFILMYFGSDINGLVSSINQYLSFITLLELGVGSVVQAALYRPIAQHDSRVINKILSSANHFFNNVAKLLLVYVVILIFAVPLIVDSPLGWVGTAFLILAMSISLFSQYYFGLVNQIFLNANQLNYTHTRVQIGTLFLNTIVSVGLMVFGFSIQVVRLVTSLIFLLKPLYMKWYVDKHFAIDLSIETKGEEVIPQKWNGMLQHAAYTVTNSTDMIVLSLFSTLQSVSVYSVHNLVTLGLQRLMMSLTNGMQSLFGTLLAEDKVEDLKHHFSRIEWSIHNVVTLVFGLTSVLLNPFVMVYTHNVNDANYDVPIFALLMTLSTAMFCFRIPYNALILAAGHFKETQISALIEVILNIVFSILLVNLLGLNGVALGTIIAITYRTLYQVNYLRQRILERRLQVFAKLMGMDILALLFINGVQYLIPYTVNNFMQWVIYAVILAIILLLFMGGLNFIFYKEELMQFIRKYKK